jgi:hypothetical protein
MRSISTLTAASETIFDTPADTSTDSFDGFGGGDSGGGGVTGDF